MPDHLLIDGRLVQGGDERFDVVDPATGAVDSTLSSVRGSGDARELGAEALDSLTTLRHVHWNLELVPKPWWFREE